MDTRNTITKSITFHVKDDAELLYWCQNRPEQFAPFVRQVLRAAMEAEQSESGQPAGQITADQVRTIIRQELSRALQNLPSPVDGRGAGGEGEPTLELEDKLAALFD